MIESNIVKWVDLGDNMQRLDVYGMKKWVKFFNFMRILISFKKFSILFYIILKLFFFLQIIMLNLTNVDDPNDSAITILKYISTVIFIQDIVIDSNSYKLAVIINSILTLISILCIIYLIVSIRIRKFFIKIPIQLFNLINVITLNYLIGPIIQISLFATKCTGPQQQHDLLKVTCYSDSLHIIFSVVSFINFIFFVFLSIVLSIYYNEIGSINETKYLSRVNCNYEIYTNISKISMFIFAYFVKFYSNNSYTFTILLHIYFLITTFIFLVYVYRYVLFYDPRVNSTILYGWVIVTWFSCVILLKTLLKINDTSIFHLVGCLVLSLIVYYMEELKEEFLITDFNIFDAKSLKDIQLFNMKLFNLINMRSIKNKTLLLGIINKFEDLFKSNEEMQEKYKKLCSNLHLKKKFNSNSALSVLSILYIIYDHHLEKSALKNDVLLNICYFLINKLKNITFSVYLCSRIKAVSHKHLYFKYLLMEEIKYNNMNKLSKSNSKVSIKHIQIGSVILYNIYMNLFKEKIFEAVSNQIDYFDLLRNNLTTPKTTENFLQLGEDILNLRKEIIKLWERIIELNPFSEESARDYTLYVETILQDDVLARNESKTFLALRATKLSEKNNIYHSMFNFNSSVLLVDGYSNFGKILYTTPNFPFLYGFNNNSKEVLNMTIDEFLPNVVKEFHKEIVENSIRFSNILYIFSKQRDVLMKGKTGSLFNVKIYMKSVPNLCFGLIYMVSLTKVTDHNYLMVLDKDFLINGMSDAITQVGHSQDNTATNNNYMLDRAIINFHIGLLIPDILLHLEYTESRGLFITKHNTDLKGILYTLNTTKSLVEKLEKLLYRIKQHGKLVLNDEGKLESSLEEYESLCKEINNKANNSHSIFYRVDTSTFLENKFRYHRVYISSDLITINENTNTAIPSTESDDIIYNKKGRKATTNTKLKLYVKEKDSGKYIKIKFHHASNEEQNKLLGEAGDENKDKDKIKTGESGNEDHLQVNNNEQLSHFSSKNVSAFSRSSVDSASFNKLKNGILEKKEVSSIKFMRYLSFSFGFSTIILVFLSSRVSKENFSNSNSYLQQNLYFNHSKIAVSCVYLATLNMKFIKYNIYSSNHCYKPCKDFYKSSLSKCLIDLKVEKENITTFYSEFKNKLAKQKIIELELYNLTNRNKLIIDTESDLNIIVAYGLKLNSNLDDYFKYSISPLNTVSNNLLNQSLEYLYDSSISGFTDDQNTFNLSNSYFSPLNVVLIAQSLIFGVLIVGFIYFICSLYSLESFYLRKLIKFKNPPFDAYLKYLEEIKKKNNKNESNEDDQFKEELDIQEFNNSHVDKEKDIKKADKQGKDMDSVDLKDKKKSLDKNKKNKDGSTNKEKEKKRKNGKKPVKNFQEDKINTMEKFFLYWNILFCVKVFIILLLSVSDYLIVSIIDKSTNNELLQFSATSNNIEGLYKRSFDIYLSLKSELAKYIDNELTRNSYINYLNLNPGSEIEFNGVKFTSGSDLLQSKLYYKMKLPYQIETPKIGAILMPIINTDMTKATNSTIILNSLYYGNSCAVLFDNKTEPYDYNYCSTFWSSILIKGMEQSITQMNVIVTSVLDDLNSLNMQKKTINSVIAQNAAYSGYELFVEYYLLKSYLQTVDIFRKLNSDNLLSLSNIYDSIMICYICFVLILSCMLLYYVYKSKIIFNTFMNFIGILPARFLVEDPILYKEILKLEQYIYF